MKSKILLTMYIDSPQFPKRKIMNGKNQFNGGFGFERIQLANYVADQLNNNHRDDAIILEKFRKQASQYKRNLLRRNHSPAQTHSQPAFQSIQSLQSVKIKPLTMVSRSIIQPQIISTEVSDETDKNAYRQQRSQRNPVIVHEVTKIDSGNKELIKILQKKDRQLQKQAKIIRKNQVKLNDLKKRIDRLELQKKIKEEDRISAIEQKTYQKMKGYIATISNKLEQNNQLMERNLSQVHQPKKISLNLRKSSGPDALLHYSPQLTRNKKLLNPEQTLEEPKISYHSYKVSSEKQILEQKKGLKEFLSNLKKSRNRLDALGSFV